MPSPNLKSEIALHQQDNMLWQRMTQCRKQIRSIICITHFKKLYVYIGVIRYAKSKSEVRNRLPPSEHSVMAAYDTMSAANMVCESLCLCYAKFELDTSIIGTHCRKEVERVDNVKHSLYILI